LAVFDTAKPGVEQIRRRVSQTLRPGAIVALHDGDGYDPEGDRMQTAMRCRDHRRRPVGWLSIWFIPRSS